MKPRFVLLFFMMSFSLILNAQKGSNQIKAIVEGGIATGYHQFGYGGFLKGFYGIGASSQLTLSAGVSKFKLKSSREPSETITRLVPILAGYRWNLSKFYLEPQVGYGELGGRIKMNDDYARPSTGAFFVGFGTGYNFKKIDICLRYQNAHGVGASAAGLWHDSNFRYVGLDIGFKLL